MSQDYSDICRQGYVRHKTKKLPTWNKRWFILCKRSSKGNPRIERYADERAAQLRNEPKCTELIGVKNMVRCPAMFKKHAVSVEFKEGNNDMLFCCESDYDADEWLRCMKEVCSYDNNSPPMLASPLHTRATIFPVYLLPNPLLSCYGECLMCVTSEDLVLLHLHESASSQDQPQIASWKLATLRRYGRDDDKFTFECGRSSKTGEGLFIFNTVEGEAIYQSVHSATLAIASAHSLTKTPQGRLPFSYSKSVKDVSPSTQQRVLRPTKSSPGDRAPLPLPRLTKPRARSPPPVPEPLPDSDSEERSPMKPRAPSPPSPSSDSDKDDYEILADAPRENAPLPSFPISSVDSMLSSPDPEATPLTLHPQNKIPEDAESNISEIAVADDDIESRVSESAAMHLEAQAQDLSELSEVTTNGELNNNDTEVEGAVGGINTNTDDAIYEEKYLAAPFRKFLQMRKEDDGYFV